jgi:hypothetical protein
MENINIDKIINENINNKIFMSITVENILDTFSILSLFIDISRVAESSNPKLTKILKYIIIEKEKFTNPKFSAPSTRTK